MKKIIVAALLFALIVVCNFNVALAKPASAQAEAKAQVLIGFTVPPGPNEQALIHHAGGYVKYTYRIIPVIAAEVPEKAIPGLLRNPNITHIESDGIAYAIEEQPYPWNVERVNAHAVHNSDNKGTGVKVAVIDTGIDKDHPDLAANIKGGVNLLYQWTGLPIDPEAWDDDNGHGSHVAGIIAAVDNDMGVIGVAPEAWLYGVKVLNQNGAGYWSDIIAGIDWAVDPNGDLDYSDRMDVINMSLGGTKAPSDLGRACNEAAYFHGVILVGAAGNSGDMQPDDDVIWPAKYEAVIAVAATDSDDNRASWSSDGPEVFLAAPGVSIYSTYKNGGYATMSGTSMASPHVAGVAALVIAGGGLTDLTGDGDINGLDVKEKLKDTAKDLGTPGFDYWYGWGLVDAAAATLEGNQPPVADAGPDQTVSDADGSGAETVILDGSASSDPDGNITDYEWAESGNVLSNAAFFTGEFSVGTHTIVLTVTDNGGATAQDTVVVTVNANQDPIANAGTDQTVSDADGSGAETVTLDGSASSDPDGTITSYEWTESTSVLGTTAVITPSLAVGNHTITLTVTDNGGATAIDEVLITVMEATPLVIKVDSINLETEIISRGKGSRTRAIAGVTIIDGEGVTVDGVVVYGHWSGLTKGDVSAITNGDGLVSFTSRWVKDTSGTFTFTVDSIVKEGYDPQGVPTSNSIDVP